MVFLDIRWSTGVWFSCEGQGAVEIPSHNRDVPSGKAMQELVQLGPKYASGFQRFGTGRNDGGGVLIDVN